MYYLGLKYLEEVFGILSEEGGAGKDILLVTFVFLNDITPVIREVRIGNRTQDLDTLPKT